MFSYLCRDDSKECQTEESSRSLPFQVEVFVCVQLTENGIATTAGDVLFQQDNLDSVWTPGAWEMGSIVGN